LDSAGLGSLVNSPESSSTDLEYWRGQLSGELPRLQLPFDHLRSSEENRQRAAEPFELPESLSQGLKRLAEKSGCSLYVTLLTGVALLSQRYSGQDEMIIGGAIAESKYNQAAGQLEISKICSRCAWISRAIPTFSNFNHV